MSSALERARERFRKDVAGQLRMAADKAGLAASVAVDDERAVLEFDETGSGAALLRVIVVFDDPGGAAGHTERLTLGVESGEEATVLLSLAWRGRPGLDEAAGLDERLAGLEARTDESLPLERRGLNAAADERTGRYAKGDAVRQLAGDLKRAAAQAPPVPIPSHALVPVDPPRPVALPAVPDGQQAPERTARRAPQRPPTVDVKTQRANVSELLISSLIQTMQRDLAGAESHFAGLGAAASARGRLGRAMEWAMLGTAYGVEAKTNQIAVASFLGAGPASWLYGLVGPVLIGGLAAVSRSKTGKSTAYALMLAWAVAMASIAASDRSFLDRAQAYFPKAAVVLTHEQAVAAARLRKEAAQAELTRLSAPAKQTSELLAQADERWQAAQIKRAAELESARRDKDRAKAGATVVEAGVALSGEELRLREAILNDPSRAWAWRTLFAIFAVINLAGPLAIARVLEQWRADHAAEQEGARDGHRRKAAAALLRGSRAAQKAHAMLLLPALLANLRNDGAAPEAIAALDLGDIAQKAAERFDRGVNARRAAWRLFGAWGPGEGPG
jgi:hypothetical protein